MNRIGSYTNGNYRVYMFDDGTKIRYNNKDTLEAAFPESMDIKICNRCDRNCHMCHEQSTPDGKLGNLEHPLLDSLHPYTELAIGGGNPLSHPGLKDFLTKMKEKKVICNMTVNVHHFMMNYDKLLNWNKEGLIHGLGISVNTILPDKIIERIAGFPNAVVHVIAGLITANDLKPLFDHNIRLLVLGYKDFGRGKDHYKMYSDFIDKNINLLEKCMPQLIKHFALISFDNLAITQLHVKDHMSEDRWNTCYMGDDGEFTMYVDLVKNEYAISSVSSRHEITSNNIDDLFQNVKREIKAKQIGRK